MAAMMMASAFDPVEEHGFDCVEKLDCI